MKKSLMIAALLTFGVGTAESQGVLEPRPVIAGYIFDSVYSVPYVGPHYSHPPHHHWSYRQ